MNHIFKGRTLTTQLGLFNSSSLLSRWGSSHLTATESVLHRPILSSQLFIHKPTTDPVRFKFYKLKTHSGTKKRWAVLKSGGFKRGRPGKSHLNVGKSSSQLNRLSKQMYARGFQEKELRRLMPYAK